MRTGLIILLLAVSGGAQPAPPTRPEPPNIVLVMADDIGRECFSWHGGTSYRTPRLDALAKGGMRFMHCHAQPVCTPSRVKLMTGQSNVRNYVAFGVLAPDQRTFGHMLRDAGYATAVAGKWQLYGADHYPEEIRGAGTRPEDAGFDRYCLWQVEKLGQRYWKPTMLVDGELREGDEDDYGPDTASDYLLEFMAENRERPFFAYYPMALVHSPYVPPPGGDPADRRRRSPDRDLFAAMVTHMDTIVGRIVDKVAELGLAERTLILFTTDNGTGRKIRSQQNGREVRGGKNRTTNAGTHVPLVAYWPGTVPAGTSCSDLVDFSDFVPTLMEVAGATLPEDLPIDGRSFTPQLRGERGEPREWLFCYFHPRPITRPKSAARRFARDHRFKLYANGDLFDVEADPLEGSPLEPADAGEAAAARVALQHALDSMPSRSTRIGRLR